jgi:hypothetical protein
MCRNKRLWAYAHSSRFKNAVDRIIWIKFPAIYAAVIDKFKNHKPHNELLTML